MDTSDNTDLACLSQDELESLRKVNDETITELEKQINLLKKKIQLFGPRALPDNDFEVSESLQGENNVDLVNKRLQDAIDHHAMRLKETIRLTGVKVDTFSQKILSTEEDRCSKELSLELQIHESKVILKCVLEKFLDENETASDKEQLRWFEILFEEDIHNVIGKDVARAADNLALHSSVSLVKTFIDGQALRERLFASFKESYPESISATVTKKGCHSWKIGSLKKNRPVFEIVWDRRIVDSKVEPEVKLQVEASQEIYDKDSDNILKSAPRVFSTMITTVGVELALKGLIELVALDDRSPGYSQETTAQQPVQESGNPQSDDNNISSIAVD